MTHINKAHPVSEAKRVFGQYMTPAPVAALLARQVPSDTTAVVDLAAGDGSLLRAFAGDRPHVGLYGFEIDERRLASAMASVPSAKLRLRDGLSAALRLLPQHKQRIAVVGNPPFIDIAPSQGMRRQLIAALPGLTTKLGSKRSEVYFLARSLLLARRAGGVVAILMPAGFADGDVYAQYRRELMSRYCLLRAIEVPASAFTATEARTTLLVIDTSRPGGANTVIAQFDARSNKVKSIYNGPLEPGDRLDARYYSAGNWARSHAPRLVDLGVSITRGHLSNKQAKGRAVKVVHTTDLARAHCGHLEILNEKPRALENEDGAIYASCGDILLPRTGSRVAWKPVFVTSGSALITDHVFRIRAPREVEHIVEQAFRHPAFAKWLKCVSKGVCATVLTKRELLRMPIFHLLNASSAVHRA